MHPYKAPLRDIRFVFNELLDAPSHYAKFGLSDALSPDVWDAILEEAACFAEDVLAPTNAVGDEQGCQWSAEGVRTPEGFIEAYRQFVAGGWGGICANPEFGGQGLPASVGTVINEMIGSANWSWCMYPGLTASAIRCLEAHGTAEQKSAYLHSMASGEWSGTMCLTEAHCGSDLGLLRTKATPQADGSYRISGSKIFITGGEHDLTENIVHLVLARIEGAPSGTKGISLFIVPKFLPDANGKIGQRNALNCGSIEHKMGIKGSSTCVMNFDGATGFLLGEENQGLRAMFTMMNSARLGTALQGLALAELSFQGALAYARDRLQMRSLTGPKNPAGQADPIIVHPDVRRMLLTQKALTEGSRAFIYWLTLLVDKADLADDNEAEELLALLTPIAKAFITETGYEATNLGLQVFGGHGYIREWGMEQIVRDTRIAMVYEGTTGIQALDLLGRKIMANRGASLTKVIAMIESFCNEQANNSMQHELIESLHKCAVEWGDMTRQLGFKGMQNPDEIGAASVDYLMYSGYVILAWFWAQMAVVAQQKITAGENSPFYQAKLKTAQFYYARLLPRTAAHHAAVMAGADTLMAFNEVEFSAT
jgi:alkylation response protein AidB-like acyl-CoA dehydrogenase